MLKSYTKRSTLDSRQSCWHAQSTCYAWKTLLSVRDSNDEANQIADFLILDLFQQWTMWILSTLKCHRRWCQFVRTSHINLRLILVHSAFSVWFFYRTRIEPAQSPPWLEQIQQVSILFSSYRIPFGVLRSMIHIGHIAILQCLLWANSDLLHIQKHHNVHREALLGIVGICEIRYGISIDR